MKQPNTNTVVLLEDMNERIKLAKRTNKRLYLYMLYIYKNLIEIETENNMKRVFLFSNVYYCIFFPVFSFCFGNIHKHIMTIYYDVCICFVLFYFYIYYDNNWSFAPQYSITIPEKKWCSTAAWGCKWV